MFGNFTSDHLKSGKTEKSLYDAMFSLLRKTSFRKLTIKGICEEALISRAAFYAHFIDKYDLLSHWIPRLIPSELFCLNSYEDIEKIVNEKVQEYGVILKNLVSDADNETFGILFNFLLSTISLTLDSNADGEVHSRNVVLANFYGGGIISYFLWQIRSKFPTNVPVMNPPFYEIIRELQNWHTTQNQNEGDMRR